MVPLRARHRALRPYCHTARMGRPHPLLRRGSRRGTQSQSLPQLAIAATHRGAGMNAPDLETLQKRMASAVMQPLTRDETMRRRTSTGTSMAKEADAFIKP